jgi:hypothetical protein
MEGVSMSLFTHKIPEPGDKVEYSGDVYVVVDVADYREEEDGGKKDVFCVLRYQDSDPRRQLDVDGGDNVLDVAPPASECKVVGHI